MFDLKKKLVLLGIPALVAGGALSVVAVAAATPAPTAAVQAEKPEAAEAAETTNAAEAAAEANEPTLPGGGHADAEGADVDHQFEGVE